MRTAIMVTGFLGQRHYLWRAVDQDGDVIDILVQRHRDAHAESSPPPVKAPADLNRVRDVLAI